MCRGTSWISIPAKHKQCSVCGKIKVYDEWFFPLDAIQKGVNLNEIVCIPECPPCKKTITFNIITNAFRDISGI